MRFLFSRPDAKFTFRMIAGMRERRWLPQLVRIRSEVDMGMLYVVTVLDQSGHETEIFDPQIFRRPEAGMAGFLAAIDRYRPDAVALNAITGTIEDAAKMAALVKERSDALVILGGHHATALPKRTLEEFPQIDLAVFGEGEETMVEVADALEGRRKMADVAGVAWRDKDRVVQNPARPPIEDLDALPFPDRRKVDFKRYLPNLNDYVTRPSTLIIGGRGCVYRCGFCARTGARHPGRLVLRSAGNLLEEIEQCRRDFGIRDFRFPDDTFTYDPARVVEFCEGILRRNLRITWSCYACPNEVDPDLLALMKRSGCFLIKYGIETGNEESLRQMKKSFTLEKARQAIAWTRAARIQAFGGWIIGWPGETVEDIQRTIDFAVEISPDISVFASLALFPGSPVFDEMERAGRILHYRWSRYLDTATTVYRGQLPGETLQRMVALAFRRFYLRPRYVLQALLRIFRYGHPLREIRNIVMGFIDLF